MALPAATLYQFSPGIVQDATRNFAARVTGYLYATTADALADKNRLPVFDWQGNPLPNNALVTNDVGFLPQFAASTPYAFVNFGGVVAIQEVAALRHVIDDLQAYAARLAYLEGVIGKGGTTTTPGTGTPGTGTGTGTGTPSTGSGNDTFDTTFDPTF